MPCHTPGTCGASRLQGRKGEGKQESMIKLAGTHSDHGVLAAAGYTTV